MEQFDQFSHGYKRVLDKSIRISGDSAEYFAKYKAQYISKSIGSQFAGKVLDFGCGIGMLSQFIKYYVPGALLHGYDVSSSSIKMVDKQLKIMGLYTSDLDMLDSDYGLIIVSNVLHHISPKSRLETINRLAEMTSEGGKIFVFEHNPANPVTRMVVDRCPFDRDAVLLPPEETINLYTNSGYRLLRTDYIVFFPKWLSFLRSYESALFWCPIGAQYVVVGEKNG